MNIQADPTYRWRGIGFGVPADMPDPEHLQDGCIARFVAERDLARRTTNPARYAPAPIDPQNQCIPTEVNDPLRWR